MNYSKHIPYRLPAARIPEFIFMKNNDFTGLEKMGVSAVRRYMGTTLQRRDNVSFPADFARTFSD
jgi:hypothetical protein